MEIIQRTTLWDARNWNMFWIHTEKLVVCWSHCTYLILLWFSSKKHVVRLRWWISVEEEYYRLLQKFENPSPRLRTQGESSRTVRRNEEQKRNEGCQHHSGNYVLPAKIHVEICIKCKYSTNIPQDSKSWILEPQFKKKYWPLFILFITDLVMCEPILRKDNFFKWLKNPINSGKHK